MRQDNRGVSLVEIIIVVAIIAVLGGVGIWGLNAMTGRPAQQCAQKIVYSLERHRTTAMGKVQAEYWLVEDNNRVYVEEYLCNDPAVGLALANRVEIGSSGVKVQYMLGTDPTLYDLTQPLKLAFDRSTGAFKPQPGGGYCTKIIAKRGGREFEVTLVPLTGKVYID